MNLYPDATNKGFGRGRGYYSFFTPYAKSMITDFDVLMKSSGSGKLYMSRMTHPMPEKVDYYKKLYLEISIKPGKRYILFYMPFNFIKHLSYHISKSRVKRYECGKLEISYSKTTPNPIKKKYMIIKLGLFRI